MGLFDKVGRAATDTLHTVADAPGSLGRKLGGKTGGKIGDAFEVWHPFARLAKGGSELTKLFSRDDREEMGIPDPLTGRLEEETAGINKELASARKSLREREQEARKGLASSTQKVGEAIDVKLAEALEDTGFQVGEAVQGAGIGQAARGIGRSTFAAEQVGNIFQAGDEQRGQLRAQAAAQKTAAAEKAQGAARSIADKRVSVSNRLRDLERQGLQSAQFQGEIQQIQMDFEKMVADANLPAESMITSMLGELGLAGGDK